MLVSGAVARRQNVLIELSSAQKVIDFAQVRKTVNPHHHHRKLQLLRAWATLKKLREIPSRNVVHQKTTYEESHFSRKAKQTYKYIPFISKHEIT